MKIARNCENIDLPRSFRKWEWGRVSSRRPLSGKTALVGNESRFCRSRRPRDQSLTEEFSDMGSVAWGCRLVGKLSGMKDDFIWAGSALIYFVRCFVYCSRVFWTALHLKCLENAFLAINFFKIFWGRAPVGFAPSALADEQPSLVGKACPCPPQKNRFHPVRLWWN